ncbi:MAG: serine--tRNA ligase [Actinobacteria bacterium]|nr:serine--tRNA ligase [Actinomycetota bacterium]MCL6105644.1 serine--tRNA ligase [Actinomycetota bacterium]
MIDIRLLREDFNTTKTALQRRGVETADIDRLVFLDEKHRRFTARRDQLRSEIKKLSAQISALRRSDKGETVDQLTAKSKSLSNEEKAVSAQAESVNSELRSLLLILPNLPDPDCPDGLTAESNVIIRSYPTRLPEYPLHQRVPHWDIGKELDILDMERGAKLSGSMFPLYKGMGAALVRALTSFALDLHADTFTEIQPPTLVRTQTMMGSGHLPKFSDEAYQVERDDLWAIPTAEVPLTSMFADEILEQSDLPILLTAHTPCFRREAGAAGSKTRGLLRLHEFNKVELFGYVTQDQAADVHSDMLRRAEELCKKLGLSYRVLDLCAGDMGLSAKRTYDVEVYAPGCDQWLEVSSVSWCGDYQARRANIRYRSADRVNQFVHTLNGSALAWPRIWAALVETYRLEDGSVEIPQCLQHYMRGVGRITK